VSTDFGGPSGGPATPSAGLPPPSRAPSASACEAYRELIEQAVARGRNAMAIWQDLVDDHGFPGRYASVRRFVVKLRGQRTLKVRVTVHRDHQDRSIVITQIGRS
jgi:hypothetical protein